MNHTSLRAGPRRGLPWLAWILTRAFGIAGVYGLVFYGLPGVYRTSSDISLYGAWGWLFQHGYLPYHSYPVQYPPGVLPFLVIPAISAAVYQGLFLGLALLSDGYVFHRLRRSGLRAGSSLWLLGAILLGPIFWTRLDVFLAASLVLAVLEWNCQRPERAALWIGAAAALKVWPILLLLPLVLALTGRRRVRTALCGVAAPLFLVLPVAAWGGLPGLWDAVHQQAGRGVEVESIFALPLELARTFHVLSVGPRETMSWEFDGRLGAMLGAISTLVLLLGLAGWLAVVVHRRRLPFFPLGPALLLLSAILVSTAKVLSPQYALWVLAGAAVVCDRTSSGRRLVVATGAFLVTTQALFPFAFGGLISGNPISTVGAVLHVGAVFALLGAAAASWSPEADGPVASESEAPADRSSLRRDATPPAVTVALVPTVSAGVV